MTEYTVRIDEKSDITLVEITGSISLGEQFAFMSSSSFGERTLRVIGDMRSASLEKMSRGSLAKLARSIKPFYKPGMRGAYVFRRGEDFAKGKLLMAQLETLGFEGKFRVFTEMEKARSWIQL